MEKNLNTKKINDKLNFIVLKLYNSSKDYKKLESEGKRLASLIKKNFINKRLNYYIFKFNKINLKNLKEKIIIFSSLFGKPIAQNYKNNKFIEVSPNKKMIKKFKNSHDEKLRYHQTNKGGSIHTDGPQLVNPPKLIMMGCINNEVRGGHSILVSGHKLFNFLKNKNPTLIKTLKQKFYFECRGFFKNKSKYLYKPIFDTKKKFKIRYLREYILTAYKKKNLQLSITQNKALSELDKGLENKKNQQSFKINKGDVLIINNQVMAHGRSAFSIKKNNSRKLLRIWAN